MKKILHLGKYYFPEFGGIESVTRDLAEGAVRAGFEVEVLCFSRKIRGENIFHGVHVIYCEMPILIASQPIGFRYCFEAFRRIGKCHVVHVHLPNILASLLVGFASRRVKVALHWHSDIVSKGWLGWLVRPIELFALRRANSIICTSRQYASASSVLQDFMSKVDIVPIGVAEVNSNLGRVSLPPDLLEFVANRKIVLSVGRIVSYKGFDVLVEACKNLDPDICVLIVGSGPLLDELRAKIASCALASKVRLLGRVDDELLSMLFRSAKLFCLPSVERSEAFGVVLLEAMRLAIPIVATDISGSGVPWVNASDVSGINVPPFDSQALAEAINYICGDEMLHARLSSGALDRFLSKFTLNESISNILKIYN